MILSKNNHLINQNLDAVRLQFANGIDTLKNNIKKTVLLSSSPFSKTDGVPREIRLKIDAEKLDKTAYKSGNIITSVLLEGAFTSVYKDRVRPLELNENTEIGKVSKMIVVADGDIIRNDISENTPLELGLDKWTHRFYDNKAFLQNAVNYLLDDTQFLILRNKKVQLPFLDKEKVADTQKTWKIKSFIYPLFALCVIFFAIRFYHRKINVHK